MMHDMGDFAWGMGAFGWVFMLLFWGLVILGIVALVKWLMKSSGPDEKRPLDILQERYAHGDISKEEFEEKKRDLQS